MVTLYSQPGCYPCKGTMRALDGVGVRYEVVDIAEDKDARDYIMSLGYQSTPVVVTDTGDHWSGHRPDKINALTA